MKVITVAMKLPMPKIWFPTVIVNVYIAQSWDCETNEWHNKVLHK
jgi:hypothetical protein